MDSAISIPKKWVSLLLGRRGRGKRILEKAFNAKLKVDPSGKIEIIECPPENYVALRNALYAISVGFAPEDVTFFAEDDSATLDIIDTKREIPKENHRKRLLGRVIGRGGSMYTQIANALNVRIRIDDDRIGIMGHLENVQSAVSIIRLILSGAQFGTVYRELERRKAALEYMEWK